LSDEIEKPDADASVATPTPDGPAPATEPEPAEAQEAPAPAPAPAKPRRAPRNPMLVRAFRTSRAIEGMIQAVIKGGYEVRIGRSRGFCPHSQIGLHREDQPESQVGKTYLFRVTQLRRGGEDVVLSRRVLLEEERAEEASAVRATLIEGHITQGHVAGTAEFGAFIDLGAGVMGLAHISELSHARIQRVDEAVKVGDTVQVKILKINEKTGKISLSVRQAQEDPWSDVAERFQVGGIYAGAVKRLADFGAFVELAPGLECLAPASEFPPCPGGWQKEIAVGDTRDWYVLSVDAKKRRVSITLPGADGASAAIEKETERSGRVQRIERYGVFVWLGPGQVGLMPRAWAGVPADGDLDRQFKVGDALDVRVVEITDDGRRIRLARSGVKIEAERPAPKRPPRQKAPEPREQPEPTGTFGTSLADKLRAALDKGGEES
jgi:small subunit ribosomal protein S1